MFEELDLTAKWGDRRQTVEECARCLADCLNRLSSLDEAFNQWYCSYGAPTPAIARERRVAPSTAALAKLLTREGTSAESTGCVVEESGCSTVLWNGLEDDAHIALQVSCNHDMRGLAPLANDCRLWLPQSGAAAERLGRRDEACGLVLAFAESWDPDIVWVSTFELWKATFPHDHRGAWVGWITYLSTRYGELPPLPHRYATEPVGERGRLIVIKDIERPTSTDATHVERVKYLGDTLRAAGLLGAPGRPRGR